MIHYYSREEFKSRDDFYAIIATVYDARAKKFYALIQADANGVLRAYYQENIKQQPSNSETQKIIATAKKMDLRTGQEAKGIFAWHLKKLDEEDQEKRTENDNYYLKQEEKFTTEEEF